MACEYFAVKIQCGASVVLALKTVRVAVTSTFWDVFEELLRHLPEPIATYQTIDIASTKIAKNQKFLPSESQSVELHHEVSVCVLFDSKFILYQLKSGRSRSPVRSSRSAFDVLMHSRTERRLPVRICRDQLKQNEALYNDILGCQEVECEMSFSDCSVLLFLCVVCIIFFLERWFPGTGNIVSGLIPKKIRSSIRK